MTRRSLLLGGAALHSRPPNIIVLVSDDHGYHDLGCQGARDVATPHLDRLAASGVRFTSWYSNAPVCAPSRAALMTGRYPLRCGVPANSPTMPATEATLPRLLGNAGYQTGAFGKWHLGLREDVDANGRGFQEFYGFHTCDDHFSHRNYWRLGNGASYHDLWHNRREVFADGRYSTELWTEKALAWAERNRANPFLLYLSYSAVHYPMQAPAAYLERFRHIQDEERRVYAAMLATIDDSVGQLVGWLERRRLRENTLIFFVSDNGATRERRAGLNGKPARGGSNAPFRGAKTSLFEGGIRVPALLSWPGRIPAGQVIGEMAMTADTLPTALAAANVPLPADRTIDGHNLLPMTTSGAAPPHEEIYWAFQGQLAVRRGPWKWIRQVREGSGEEGETAAIPVFLGNLEKDPGETTNLANQYPEIARELATRAERWLEKVKER